MYIAYWLGNVCLKIRDVVVQIQRKTKGKDNGYKSTQNFSSRFYRG